MNEPTLSSTAILKLRFKRPHRSLVALPDVELPTLTVLTGVNGAGKTHLLQAIKEGAVEVEGVSISEILYFDWTSMYKLSSSTVTRNDVRITKQPIRRAIANVRVSEDAELRRLLAGHGVDVVGEDPWEKLREDSRLRSQKDIKDLLSRAKQAAFRSSGFNLLEEINNLSLWASPYGHNGFVLLDDYQVEMLADSHPIGANGFAVADIGKAMMAYFDLDTHNKLCALDKAEGRTPAMQPRSTQEFQDFYGPPPWELLTEVMQELGLDFEIHGPESYSTPEYTPRALKRSTGTPVDLEHLSSGEKMLMALALSTYATTTRGMREANKIKLVLLDEIDAPLHPSMSRVMMKIIRTTIRKRLNCAVIIATHAPATVVVAPEDSVYVMHPAKPGVHPQSRERALRVLTADLPTLSLDFSGRRQVFVESKLDAERYERIYQLYKRELGSELSLSFIGVGAESNGGTTGAGCQVVHEMVKKLRKYGNQSVWGLVDWDGKARGSEHVKVLAEGRRYAIENCLLDPLMVAALIIDAGNKADLDKIDLTTSNSISSLLKQDASQLRQRLISAVQNRVLEQDEASSDSVDATYVGGFTHQLSTAYLQHHGHDLTKQVFHAFPSLNRHGPEKHLLKRAISILKEHPKILPQELLDALNDLLKPPP